MERLDQRQRGASKCLKWALEAAQAGTYAEVPKLLDQARAQVNDGELSGIAELYREFFELPPARELPAPDLPLTWLGRAAGEQLDALHRHLLGVYRKAGGEWEGVAMEQAFLLEPTLEHREVYSDWLQMRRDPRGEFIALQLIYAAHGLNASALARMEGLLARNLERWAGPFLRRGAAVLVFRHGFPSVIEQGRASVLELSELGFRWRVTRRLQGRDAPQLRDCRHVRASG